MKKVCESFTTNFEGQHLQFNQMLKNVDKIWKVFRTWAFNSRKYAVKNGRYECDLLVGHSFRVDGDVLLFHRSKDEAKSFAPSIVKLSCFNQADHFRKMLGWCYQCANVRII